ncbi:MAG: DUF938 domain-containing protein [Deltaproteobacteria bacterium]
MASSLPMKLDYPATGRNGAAIEEVLTGRLPQEGLVLEIASGSGQHGLRFARAYPKLRWQPSDPEDEARASIDAYRTDDGPENLLPAIRLDVTELPWPVERADALFCANMIHIAPWAATEGLFAGAERILPSGAPLILYGPFRIDGAHTAPSNESFDASLKRRNPEWGVRDLAEVTTEASAFTLEERLAMPANNFTLVFRRR